MKTHTDESPFECEECSYRTTTKDLLNTHMKKHQNVSTIQCPNCPFKARSRNKLAEHRKKHEYQSVYKCKYCTFGSDKLFPVNTHMRRIHKHEISHDTDATPVCNVTDKRNAADEEDIDEVNLK